MKNLKSLFLIAGVAIVTIISNKSLANAAAPDSTDCSVASADECTRVKISDTYTIVIYGKAKPVTPPTNPD